MSRAAEPACILSQNRVLNLPEQIRIRFQKQVYDFGQKFEIPVE